MNQDNNNQTTALLVKIILAIQILTLILFACSYFGGIKMRAEYREKEAAYQKAMDEYQRQAADYKLQSDDYQAKLAIWQKENYEYTNSTQHSTKP